MNNAVIYAVRRAVWLDIERAMTDEAVYWAVDKAVDLAVDDAVIDAVYLAVTDAVRRAR